MNSTTSINVQADSINQINFINKIFTQYVLGMALALGNVGSILNCLVFLRANLRHSPCSMYFVACSTSQLITFNFALLTRMLNFGYGIRTYNLFNWFCKIRYYITFVFVAMPRYFMILALIDRYVVSSRDALLRQWSSQAKARRFILGNTLLWLILYIHVLIYYTNESGSCLPQSHTYNFILSMQYSIDSGILPVVLMFIFGWLTLRNIRAIGRHIRPLEGNRLVANLSRKDLQLVKVLTNQMIIFIIFNMPLPFFATYQLVTAEWIKSPFYLAVELFVNNLVHCLVYVEYALTFIINMSTSNLFRFELKQFLQIKLCRYRFPQTTATMIGINTRVR